MKDNSKSENQVKLNTKKENQNGIFLTEKDYDTAMEIIKCYDYKLKVDSKNKEPSDFELNETQLKYKKWEKMYQEIQFDEIITNPHTSQVLNNANKQDIRKQRQFFEKPHVPKVESCIIFKNKADQIFKEKNWEEARKIYDFSLSFLFITRYCDDESANDLQKELRNSIFMNISMCYINLNKHKNALEYLKDCYSYNHKNLKCIYRIAFCYELLGDIDKSKEYINLGLNVDNKCQELIDLNNSIKEKERIIYDKQKKAFKSLINN